MTDLDRLKTWMEQKGYDSASLSRELQYATDWVGYILNGNRHIRNGFLVRMAASFGMDLPVEIFSDYFSLKPVYLTTRLPEQMAAQMCVQAAVRTKELLPATAHDCISCSDRANLYHHQSYLKSDWLNVLPMCFTCHSHLHNNKLKLPLGVVPMNCGLVRIAISQVTQSN